MPKLIPLYNSHGELQDKVTEQRLTRLHELGLIARIVRHHKGHINRAVLFRRENEGGGANLRDCPGTQYSFREHLAGGNVAWTLKKLGHGDELRSVFLQVVTDCLVES
jgi:hypothetical protein